MDPALAITIIMIAAIVVFGVLFWVILGPKPPTKGGQA
jgi:hypothetical protein